MILGPTGQYYSTLSLGPSGPNILEWPIPSAFGEARDNKLWTKPIQRTEYTWPTDYYVGNVTRLNAVELLLKNQSYVGQLWNRTPSYYSSDPDTIKLILSPTPAMSWQELKAGNYIFYGDRLQIQMPMYSRYTCTNDSLNGWDIERNVIQSGYPASVRDVLTKTFEITQESIEPLFGSPQPTSTYRLLKVAPWGRPAGQSTATRGLVPTGSHFSVEVIFTRNNEQLNVEVTGQGYIEKYIEADFSADSSSQYKYTNIRPKREDVNVGEYYAYSSNEDRWLNIGSSSDIQIVIAQKTS